MARDLLDVLTPENTDAKDFINTEHLLTSVVVVARGQEKEWKNCYETLASNVVPASSKKFAPIDKDGNTLLRTFVRQFGENKNVKVNTFNLSPLLFVSIHYL